MSRTSDPGTELIVGTYARLGGAGLVPLTLTPVGLIVGDPAAGIIDASFGIRMERSGRWFFVKEQPEGSIGEWRRDPAWRREAAGNTQGSAPCHLALDPSERLLAVANYESGSVALFDLEGSGPLADKPKMHLQLTGHGADPERQSGPHAHWVGFSDDGQWLYCVDLGSDRILRFALDRDGGTLGPAQVAYQAPAGSGPRHVAFHPTQPRAFLVSELASTLTLLTVQADGRLEATAILSTLPTGAGESLGGAILLNAAGDRLYVTNRGHDSIALFAIDEDGASALGHVSSGGASPRFLLPLEDRRRLLVANEEGGTVSQFSVGEDGRLTPLGKPIAIPGAVFLARLTG
jgi:6-phosphogluconolactonase